MFNAYLNLLAHFGIGGAHPGGFTLTKTILEGENIQPTDSVLDIGCGTGQTAAFLAQTFDCEVTAVDNHPIMLDKAQERFNHYGHDIKLMEGDAQNLNLVNHSFDWIIAESVIIFTDISKTLCELARVLKSDGSLIMIEMTAEHHLSEELQRKVRSLYGIQEVLSEEEWNSKLQNAGFTKIEKIDTPARLIKTEITDSNQSENTPTDFYDLWEEHHKFIEQNSHSIGFRAFRCHLS
jgi:ubiquinone/menaquinone biosynthesis C-methylase UbiE